MGSKLKRPQENTGKSIRRADEPISTNNEHPIFCLKYLTSPYSIPDLSKDDRNALISKLYEMSLSTWNALTLAPRHGAGSEKMPVASIKAKLPAIITAEVEHLLVFRYNGKKALIGKRDRHVFHLIIIDHNFTAYKH